MARYQQYGDLDDKPVEQQDLGFIGYNNRTREDLLQESLLTQSVNGQIDRNGKWQIRKGLLETSEALATSASAILLNTASAELPFTLADNAVNLIYASCGFSDPKVNISEVVDFSDTTNTDYIVIATNLKASVIDVRLSTKQDVYYPATVSVSKKGDAIQAFDKVIVFQDGVVAIEWDGNLADVVATNFVVGQSYRIEATGNTDFTAIGAADSNPGTIFEATGVGTGTGTAKTTFMEVKKGAYPSLNMYDSTNNTVISNGVATVTESAHGLKVGDLIICLDKGSSSLVNETAYRISTVTDVNTFTFFTTTIDSVASTVKYMQKQSLGLGYMRMPAPAFGVNFQRRLAVPFKWDVSSGTPAFQNIHDGIVLSAIKDTDTYDKFDGGFRFEVGSDDYLVGLHAYSDEQIIALMRDSVHVLTVPDTLNAAVQTVISTEIGCVARKSVVQVGNQIIFLSDNGVYALDFQDLYNLRGKDLPISEPITNSIDKLNKDYWQNSFAVYFNNRYFLAVPSSDSISQSSGGEGSNPVARKINRILIYNILNKQWESELFVDSTNFEIDNMIVAGNGEFKQLYIITKFGAIQYFGGDGNLDVVATSLNTTETLNIPGIVETRGYNFGTTEIKKFSRFELQVESGNESVDFDITALVQDIDLVSELGKVSDFSDGNLQQNEDFYVRGRIGNPRGYTCKLRFDNFEGRPTIKTLKMSANNTLKSTDTIE